jgi:trimethylamine:corrinoid methyltransferase-like protein
MRATELWPKILQEFEPPQVDPAVEEALQAYMAHRKEELKGQEPITEPTS